MEMTLILHLNINLDGIWNSRTGFNESVHTHIVSTISEYHIKYQDNERIYTLTCARKYYPPHPFNKSYSRVEKKLSEGF